MFFEFVQALLTLDIGWFAWVVSANIIYLFAFLMVCYYFWNENMRTAIIGLFLISITAWAYLDFETVSGWVLFSGSFLAIYYITKLAAIAFAEDVPALRNKLVIVSEVQFLALVIIYNLFMR